jgi:hypothetical protein
MDLMPGSSGPNYASIEAVDVDPYIDWVLGPGRPHFFLPGRQDRWFPVMVRLKGITVRAFQDGEGFIPEEDRKDWADAVRVFSDDLGEPVGRDDSTFCSAMLRVDYERGKKKDGDAPTRVKVPFFEVLQGNLRARSHVTGVSVGLPLDREPPRGLRATPAGRKGRR